MMGSSNVNDGIVEGYAMTDWAFVVILLIWGGCREEPNAG